MALPHDIRAGRSVQRLELGDELPPLAGVESVDRLRPATAATPQSEVIRAIMMEDSPCCWPRRRNTTLTANGQRPAAKRDAQRGRETWTSNQRGRNEAAHLNGQDTAGGNLLGLVHNAARAVPDELEHLQIIQRQRVVGDGLHSARNCFGALDPIPGDAEAARGELVCISVSGRRARQGRSGPSAEQGGGQPERGDGTGGGGVTW